MKLTPAAGLLILSALIAPSLTAAKPVEATLSLPHDQVLPGVPFDMVVTVTNVTDRWIVLDGARATLVITFADGEPTVMHQPEGFDQWTIAPSVPVRVGPGESVQLAASWETGGIPNWFKYSSFSGPGTYGVALDLRLVDESTDLIAEVRTPSVTVTRIEPVGIDAELWKRMQKISGGKWSDSSFSTTAGAGLADEIIQVHPESGYYPYVLALRALLRANKDQIPALLEAAARFTDSPAYPYILSAAANCARYVAITAQRQGDVATAEKYFKLAQSKYTAALATRSVSVRNTAEEGLRAVTRGLEKAAKQAH